MTIRAHSKSEYKRLTALGADVAPPVMRTCCLCSAYKRRSQVHGLCTHWEACASASSPVCYGIASGWHIKWQASGLVWKYTDMGWTLFGEERIGYIAALTWYRAQDDRALIHRDARSLVASVTKASGV